MPVATTDGRNVALDLGTLLGEGAHQLVHRPEHGAALAPPRRDAQAVPTYYGLSPIKAPPWRAWVPLYLYLGGLGGGAAVIAGVAATSPQLQGLSARARRLAAGATLLGTSFLIADLGRPARFLHMLRVFRPTSAMNLASWILTVSGSGAVASVVLPRRARDAAAIANGVFGTVLGTYTAALLSNTVVPLWREGRRTLPFLFAASAAVSAASALLLVADDPREVRALRRVAMAGLAGELAAGAALTVEVGLGPAGEPLRRGRTGALWIAANVLGVAALVTLVASDSRRARWAAAGLGTLGALATRFAVHDGGRRSAEDPLATFTPHARRARTKGRTWGSID